MYCTNGRPAGSNNVSTSDRRAWHDEPMPDDGAATFPRRGRPGYDGATVLRRAIEVFNRQGYEATSVGDLARELGLSKSAIYHHVPGKEALLESALDEALDGLTAVIDHATEAEPDLSAHDRLRSAVRQSVAVLVEHLPAVTLLLRVRGNSPIEQSALARRRAIDERLAGLVRAAVAEGSLRSDIAPEVISRLLFGTVNSLVEWYDPDGPVSVEELSASLVALAFDGLAVDAATELPSQASKSTVTSSETGRL
jgi:AcrR family transcriptional regulator